MKVADLINRLQNLPDRYKELPIKLIAENGLLLSPNIKYGMKDGEHVYLGNEPDKIILTWIIWISYWWNNKRINKRIKRGYKNGLQ